MLYQLPEPTPIAIVSQSENTVIQARLNENFAGEYAGIKQAAQPSPPETLPAQFSPNSSLQAALAQKLPQQLINQHITAGAAPNIPNRNKTKEESEISTHSVNIVVADSQNQLTQKVEQPVKEQQNISEQHNDVDLDQLSKTNESDLTTLLLGVFIRQQEVGSLEAKKQGDTLLLPLADFASITGFTIENNTDFFLLKTPAGNVRVAANELKIINKVAYISDALLKEKLATNVQLNLSDLVLVVDVPWRRGSEQSTAQEIDIKPEVKAPNTGLSSLRQELNIYSNFDKTDWRSSTRLGGRILGGNWLLRLDNNFVNSPEISEYFFYNRSGRFSYQIGRQQIGLHPLLSGNNFTGLQLGYTNMPSDRLNTSSYSATELFPRRSQPMQTFSGVVPPASFVQLRIAGVVVAQQQVGLSGEYIFPDINLPTGTTNDIELLVFDRNNVSVPIEIRSLRLRASDLLLPPGKGTQLLGLGLTGNYVQQTLFDDFAGRNAGDLTAFYQVRQGITSNLTLESSVQFFSDTTQAQAGFAWRLAPPAVLAASVGTSRGEIGYQADFDFQLNRLRINANSEFFPSGYLFNSQSRTRFNHSLETNYKFSDRFSLGFIARSRQFENDYSSYILPTFSFNPANNLAFRGAPDFAGNYNFNAFYQPTKNTRMSFNATGEVYSTDFSYNLSQEYGLSLGTESGGDLPTRYTLILNRNAPSLSALSWRVGLGYRDGEIGPVIGASMRVLPGLFARVEYQGIPSRYRTSFGGTDDRLTISLVSDLSFAGGRVSPSESNSLGKDRGGITGRIVIKDQNKKFDLSQAEVRAIDRNGKTVGTALTDAQGNFFMGNLREGIYIVEFDPEQLPVEVAVRKTSVIAEVASSAVTQLDFPARLEYGIAGKITDASGKAMSEVELVLVDAEANQVATATTDEFGLYRIDGIPVGKYSLRIPPQANITNNESLPQLQIAITKDFIYGQDLRLPISAATKQTPSKP